MHTRTPDDLAVTFLFGNERFALDFYDVESLERLRDLAEEGVRRLRAAFELDARAQSAQDGAADHPTGG